MQRKLVTSQNALLRGIFSTRPHIMRTRAEQRACDLLVEGDLRPVLAQDAQNLLASRLQMPPVVAAHKAEQCFVRPLQGLHRSPNTWY